MSSTFRMLFYYFYKTNVLFICFFLVFYNNSTFITSFLLGQLHSRILRRPNNPGRMTLPHPLALATSDADANASADTNQTQMATMAEQHYLHPKGATPMPTQATQMPLTVTYSKKCIRSHQRQCIPRQQYHQ